MYGAYCVDMGMGSVASDGAVNVGVWENLKVSMGVTWHKPANQNPEKMKCLARGSQEDRKVRFICLGMHADILLMHARCLRGT
jgi:hypothetical protein